MPRPALQFLQELVNTAIASKRESPFSTKLPKHHFQATARFNNINMNFSKYFKCNTSSTSLVNNVDYNHKASMDSASTFTSTSSASTMAAERTTTTNKLVDASKGGNATDAFNYLFSNTNSATANGVRLNYSRI
ncbi:hypothetical protein GGI25_006451 [Coemansia spiralis]|uniref:Uncharacterized protein n=2 Tax=Coemansia TaxID=4863 RepID=A0A9W8G1A4_9FUNG|nr:hypothetical protein EDC05_006467 [Coemansia umbellata]KAJ2618573.1 hypothetical protein GGI26_006495 [Coemansia sp. RSA 1358]KAJ2668409.1 hypothetical protein GGI25_006451 [Coemansia spiralis]